MVERGSDPSPIETGRVSLGTAMAAAAGLAGLMSTQFLIQPFIWRNFGFAEILEGWRDILLGDLAVALPLALAMTAAEWLRVRGQAARLTLLAAAILAGAGGGALLAAAIEGLPAASMETLGDLLRWTMVAASASAAYAFWRAGAAAAARTQDAQRLHSEFQRLASQTDLNRLQRQIEPHFLFNTLATVRGLYRIEPDQGARLLADLMQFMRSSLATSAEGLCALGQELDLVSAYLRVCAARMGPRLRVAIEVDPCLRDREVPALALATLVENAIVHGIEPAPQGGEVRVTATVMADELRLSVVDTGKGLAPTASGGSGIGLSNTRARLRALYAEAASLTLAAPLAGGFSAILTLPSRAAA